MKQYISTVFAGLFYTFFCGLNANAENTVSTPFKLPAIHHSLFEAATRNVTDDSFETIRKFSHFIEETRYDQNENDNSELVGQMTDYASKFLGTRYRRGASGPKAFDCSGFVGFVFKKFGFNLSRSSRSQFTEGQGIDQKDIRPGDLLFFSGRAGGRKYVGHVALVVDVNPDGSCTFIHASCSKGVTYQKFPDGGYYSKRFIGAKRIIGAENGSSV